MKKIMKFIVIFVAFIFIITVGLYINHKINLSKENELFTPMGKLVEVNGYKIHVYEEGQGDETLVFMSGGGTSSPVLDFKSLYSLFSDEYKIVVIEKAGYGFSDVVDVNREIDSILSDSREVLLQSDIKGPYILFPHSMSGLEALYWADKYPEEIKGIVGLDMAFPQSYKDYNINLPIVKLGALASKIGVTRLVPALAESDAMKYGTLTEEEKQLYKVVFYRRTATITMLNEVKEVKNNAIKVGENIPNIPLLLFSSNGEGTGWDKDQWREIQNNSVSKFKHGKIIYLDCGHYVHDMEYDKIAKESKKFIKENF